MRSILIFIILGFFVFGCLGGQQQATQESASAPIAPPAQPLPKPAQTPTEPTPKPIEEMKAAPEFTIDYPTDGGIGIAGTLTVQLSASNFEIVAPGAKKDRQGHFHLYLDDGPYIPCASTACDIEGVLPGFHTIKVELRNNDHSLYQPEMAKTVKFFARAG